MPLHRNALGFFFLPLHYWKIMFPFFFHLSLERVQVFKAPVMLTFSFYLRNQREKRRELSKRGLSCCFFCFLVKKGRKPISHQIKYAMLIYHYHGSLLSPIPSSRGSIAIVFSCRELVEPSNNFSCLCYLSIIPQNNQNYTPSPNQHEFV